MERDLRLLEPLGVLGDALGNISHAVIKLSPWGTFALAAGTAGTISMSEMLRLIGYVGTYTVAVLLLTFVLFPSVLEFLFLNMLLPVKKYSKKLD